MVIERLIELMNALKLYGVKDYFLDYMNNPRCRHDNFESLLLRLLEAEYERKEEARIKRNRTSAQYLIRWANAKNIVYSPDRGFTEHQIVQLMHCHWITRHGQLIITGPTDSGKTHIACAFIDRAIRLGFSALCVHVPALIAELKKSPDPKDKLAVMTALSKPRLLLLDDWGMRGYTDDFVDWIYQLVVARYGRGSIIITSQRHPDDWYSCLGGSDVTEALLSKLLKGSEMINLTGVSINKPPIIGEGDDNE